jgi:TRAP transporter TAXI family solute receptor
MTGHKSPIWYAVKAYVPAVLLVVAAFAVAYQFVKPAPPDRLVVATGSAGGAYHAFARRYAEVFAREGITLELRNSAGSVENVRLLADGEVDVAFVQGGVEAPAGASLVSLGSLYYEPLWLFHRGDLAIGRLPELAGRRIAIGGQGSGTRALVAGLLADNGLTNAADWSSLGNEAAADALIAGDIDAAFFVMSPEAALIDRLLRDPAIRVADFSRAEAYSRRYHYLSYLHLPEGVIDLAENIPDHPVRLLAPAANLVTTEDLHPALADLLLIAAGEVHRGGGWFEAPGEFPTQRLLAFPLSDEAARHYENGPPFLMRYLPFWAASLLDRIKVMLLPLVVLLIPLIRVMPPIYQWRMRARVYRLYDRLERAEQLAGNGERDSAWLDDELQRIDAEVRRVRVPASFSDQLYHLRQHVELVRRGLRGS